MSKKQKEREQEENQRRQEFLDERKILLSKQSTNIQEFDRALITVSTFSLGYVLAQSDTYSSPVLFVIHSSIFLLCVVFTMISCTLGNRAIDKQLEINEEYYLNENDSVFDNVPCEEKIVKKLSDITWILFLIGLVLAIYVTVEAKGVTNG